MIKYEAKIIMGVKLKFNVPSRTSHGQFYSCLMDSVVEEGLVVGSLV